MEVRGKERRGEERRTFCQYIKKGQQCCECTIMKQVPVPCTSYSTIAAHAFFCCHGTFVNLVFYIQDLVYIFIYSHLEYNFVLRSSILLRGVYDCTAWEFRESPIFANIYLSACVYTKHILIIQQCM